VPERFLGGITSQYIDTPRLRTHMLASGLTTANEGPILFIHGNVSSSRFFDATLAMLSCCPPRYRVLAPDLRGFGRSEGKPVDATRGLRDFSDDLNALVTILGHRPDQKIHLVGWSLGGGIAMQYAIDHPTEVASLTLISSMPPYGMLGTKDTIGTPCWPDYAGSGGGMANPQFVERLEKDDQTTESPFSPRNVMNNAYFKAPFRVAPETEEVFVSEMLRMKVGNGNYPGDSTPSQNWPGVAPGTRGILNAISPKYCDLSAFTEITPKPPVLWIRGSADAVVSNEPMDRGRLGRRGQFGDAWPGEAIFPPQPMVSQLYALLDTYHRRGGIYQEVVLNCGHSPHIEKPKAFRQAFLRFLEISKFLGGQ
jgi:pimeloyl-ACP methyl ester carboxylesterase